MYGAEENLLLGDCTEEKLIFRGFDIISKFGRTKGVSVFFLNPTNDGSSLSSLSILVYNLSSNSDYFLNEDSAFALLKIS